MNQSISASARGAVIGHAMETTRRIGSLRTSGRLAIVVIALALTTGVSLRINTLPAHADTGGSVTFPAPNADCKWNGNQSRLMVVRGPAAQTGSSAVNVVWYVRAFDGYSGTVLTDWFLVGQRTIDPYSFQYVTNPFTFNIGAGAPAVRAQIYVAISNPSTGALLSSGFWTVTQYQGWAQVVVGPANLPYTTWTATQQTAVC